MSTHASDKPDLIAPTESAADAVLLSVRSLRVSLQSDQGSVCALDGIDLELKAGGTLGLVGESGAGKSTLARALLGLSGPEASVQGSISYAGAELVDAPSSRLRALRGSQIALIGQEAQSALHPLHRIGWQVKEALKPDRSSTRRQARAQVLELLADVGLAEVAGIYRRYPHELSGGQRQRVVIAMALAGQPRLVIADEPTSALDVTVQAQILALIRRLCTERQMALLLISHDLDVVGALCERIAVIYAGAIIEQGSAQAVLERPEHPYTWALIDAMPALTSSEGTFMPIGGSMPSALQLPSGCRFHPRCPHAMRSCSEQRPALQPSAADPGHQAACLLDTVQRQALRKDNAKAAGRRP